MCQECGRIFCAESCPGYEGNSAERGRPHGACDLCGHPFYQYDPIYTWGNRALCEICYRVRRASRPSRADNRENKSLPFGRDLSFLSKK